MSALSSIAAEPAPPCPPAGGGARSVTGAATNIARHIGSSAVWDGGNVNPRLLQCFVEVAQEQHFGRAADRLYVAQPALSRSIQQLERTLGRRLFVRTTRSVALTPTARRLLPAAREVLDTLSAVRATLETGDDSVRMAHVPCCDTAALILDALAQSDANINVQEQTMGCAQQLAAVRAGRLDVAVCRAPADMNGLRSTLVRLDPLVAGLLGRHASPERPVDPRRRTVAVADPGPDDEDFASFVSDFERAADCSLWRVPVARGSGTEAYAIRRAGARIFLTLASRGIRLDGGHRIVGTTPLQAYFPWSVIVRREDRSPAVAAFLEAARWVGRARRWRAVDAFDGTPWVPSAPEARDQWPLAP